MEPALFLGIAAVASVVFVGIDLRAPSFRAAWSSDRFRLWRNVGYVAGNVVGMATLSVVNAWLSVHVPRLGSWQWAPLVLEVVACVVVAELVNWLSHWVKHVSPWLWTFHLQHHVGRHYDTTLTLHTHPVDVVVSGAAMSALLLLLGFGRFSVDVFVLAYFVTNLYKHNHRLMSLGSLLDRVIVGPAYHRVHHTLHAHGDAAALGPDLDRRVASRRGENYGSVLTLFDVVFGTAVWPHAGIEQEPVGVKETPERGFVDEMLLPLKGRPGA
jgi:sterol desaturase/sphingolipid hydroxylase (fatty acid hydroxylase superfamily)